MTDRQNQDEALEATSIRIISAEPVGATVRAGRTAAPKRGEDIPLKTLRENMEQFVVQASYIVEKAVAASKKEAQNFQVQEFKIKASVESSGTIGFMGTEASVGAAGEIEIVFRRK